MAFHEDIKRVFRAEEKAGSGSEIYLLDRSKVVISGHRGLSFLSPERIVVRLRAGVLELMGESLAARQVSPTEIYVEGKILTLSFPGEGAL